MTFEQHLTKVEEETKGKKVNSWHEGYGLMAEEFDEFWDIVKQKPSKRDKNEALRELAQISMLIKRTAAFIENS